jgi:ATP-dependent DNA helicase RecG
VQRILREIEGAFLRIEGGARSADCESVTLDFKRQKPSDDDPFRDLAEAAVCFANGNGGAVVVGVDDKKAGPDAFVGTTLAAEAVKLRIHQLTDPPLLVHVESRTHRGVSLLLILVPQSADIHSDRKGRAVRRVGTDCLAMTPSEQLRLREERQGLDWTSRASERPLEDLAPAALAGARQSLATLTDARQKLSRLRDRDLLAALGVLSPDGVLSRAGELLFCASGMSPSPAILYQYRLTPGGEPRDVQRIEAPLVIAIQRALELVQARRTLTPVNLPNGQQLEIADFPEVAVREAIANAVIHRDYHLSGPVVIEHSPEVLVVTSPGPLVAGVTPENILTHPSRPRNPLLAKAARTLGFAEEVGRGVDRMYREMIRSGRDIPRIESSLDRVRVTLVGGAPNTQIARYAAQLPEHERDDTDTMLILFRLCSERTVTAEKLAPLLQKTVEESETSLRRLASEELGLLEPTRQTVRKALPTYRLRGEALRALGSAVSYQRRTVDELDRKVIAHVREYGKVTNRTVQNLFDVGVQRARDILRDLVQRQVLLKISEQERGPGVEYGPGPRFPDSKTRARARLPRRKPETLALPLAPQRPTKKR